MNIIYSLIAATFVSGVNPELHTFNREGECGTGAVVPWAGSLWVFGYEKEIVRDCRLILLV